MKIAILIPAYKPDQSFPSFIEKLSKQSGRTVIVVDDGNGKDFEPLFDQVKKIPNTLVLHHDINKGKGAALKTGFTYVKESGKFSGVVTADADGQHRIEDIMKVAEKLEETLDTLVMGARAFSGNVPFRSRFGNSLTRFIFRTFFRIKITDTQTGLRGIPTTSLPVFIDIPFNRYEYEAEMLLVCGRNKIPLVEVPIETVYIDNNSSSHFNPLIDSMKIYFVLLRYTLASLLSALVDFLVFISVFPFIGNILYATYTSRAVSLFVNYGLVSRKVFHAREKTSSTFPKYLLLVIISGLLSSILIYCMHNWLKVPVNLAKLVSESILYVSNFFIQKRFIFKEKKSKLIS